MAEYFPVEDLSNLQLHSKNECTTEEDLPSTKNNHTANAYLPWNDYFMALCFLTAARSKDPNRKVGACIVDKKNRVISLGYNGMPRGIEDRDLPWLKIAEHDYETKYPYVCHAEMNAVSNCRQFELDDCCMYVTKFPCSECAKIILQSGLKQVVFAHKHQGQVSEQIATRKMFALAGVICKEFIPSIQQLNLNVSNGEGNVSVLK